MTNDPRDLRGSGILTLGELQELLTNIPRNEGRWAATLDWPIDQADVWWSGESVFVSHTDEGGDRLESRICFRFPAFLGGHSDDSATLVCLHPLVADMVCVGQPSLEEKDRLDVLQAFHRFWRPIGVQLTLRNRRLHYGLHLDR